MKNERNFYIFKNVKKIDEKLYCTLRYRADSLLFSNYISNEKTTTSRCCINFRYIIENCYIPKMSLFFPPERSVYYINLSDSYHLYPTIYSVLNDLFHITFSLILLYLRTPNHTCFVLLIPIL